MEIDKNIILKAQNGNNECINIIISGSYKIIYSIFYKYFYEYLYMQDDLIQEGYLALYKSIIKYDIKSNTKLSTYMYRSIYRRIKDCIMPLKNKYNKRIYNKFDDLTDEEYNDMINNIHVNNPEDVLIDKDFIKIIDKSFIVLSDRERKILEYRLLDPKKYTFENLSIKFNLSRTTLKNDCIKAIKKIRKHVNENKYKYNTKVSRKKINLNWI